MASLPIRLEARAWDDWRFKSLAQDLGIRHADAIGRCMELWQYACNRFSEVVEAGAIRTNIGHPRAVEMLLAADLVELWNNGPLYRIKGADLWLPLWKKCEQRKDAAAAGGAARRKEGLGRGKGGKFVRKADDSQPADDEPDATRWPADDEAATTRGPRSLSSSLSDQDQISENQKGCEEPESRTRKGTLPADRDAIAEAFDNVLPITGGLR